MSNEAQDKWSAEVIDSAGRFSEVCAKFRDNNPYCDIIALDEILVDLASELWDRGFSVDEIRRAFVRGQVSLDAAPRPRR